MAATHLMNVLGKKRWIPTLQSFHHQLPRTSHSQGRNICRYLHQLQSVPPSFHFPPFKPFTTRHTNGLFVPGQSSQRVCTRFLPSSLGYCSIYSTAYHVSFSVRWPDLSHVVSRWYDYLPCHGRVYGSRNDGSVDVFCLVRYLPLFPPCTFDRLYSTFVSQLVYSAGASGFAGANGSMMIEVVVSPVHSSTNESIGVPSIQPFFHIMATRIAQDIGEGKQREIVATTLVAFAFSSVLTGMIYRP
jgi:hypothetical protein